MGLKERISNRLGRENGEDQSPSDESPEDDSVEDSDDRGLTMKKTTAGTRGNFGSSSTWIGIAL